MGSEWTTKHTNHTNKSARSETRFNLLFSIRVIRVFRGFISTAFQLTTVKLAVAIDGKLDEEWG